MLGLLVCALCLDIVNTKADFIPYLSGACPETDDSGQGLEQKEEKIATLIKIPEHYKAVFGSFCVTVMGLYGPCPSKCQDEIQKTQTK